MKIEHYSFGTITIDGKTYTSDVIIYPDKVDHSWWRKEGHSLRIVDLQNVISFNPAILIVGTGQSGAMVVPEETIAYLKGRNIEAHVLRTGMAVELFNEHQKEKRIVAALHLTC
jgi:hypothetical protein